MEQTKSDRREKHLEPKSQKESEWNVVRHCVGVSNFRQIVSILTLIRSELLHDTLTSADTHPCRVTPTGEERLRMRPCWRTLWVRMCYTAEWYKGQQQSLGRKCLHGLCGASVCLCMSLTCTIFHRSDTVQIKPHSNTGNISALTVWPSHSGKLQDGKLERNR